MNVAIFDELRMKGVDLLNGQNIRISSPDYFPDCLKYCGDSTIVASPPSCLVDNSDKTGWVSYKYDPKYQYFIIDFITLKISLTSFMFETCCCTPKEFTIKGSNNGNEWEIVAYNKSNLEFNSKYTFQTIL